jgi:hypothetical protein
MIQFENGTSTTAKLNRLCKMYPGLSDLIIENKMVVDW